VPRNIHFSTALSDLKKEREKMSKDLLPKKPDGTLDRLTTHRCWKYLPKLPKSIIISSNSKFYSYWEIIIVVVAVIQAIDVPLNLTFWPVFMQHAWYKGLNIFFDLLFFLDFFLMFLSSTVLGNGRESFDSHEICWSYIEMSRFMIDALSLLGTFPFASVSAFRMFTLLKIVRVFRISDLIRRSTFTSDVKASLNIVRLFLYLYLYIHMLGCLLWGIT
jgi:hypothetical protein